MEVNEGGEWKPIDPEKLYGIVTNNFVRGGGDGYSLFAEKAQNAYDYGPSLEQVVADYLAANSPYTPKLEGRITEVGAATAEPAGSEDKAAAPATTPPADTAAAQPAPASSTDSGASSTSETAGTTTGPSPAAAAAPSEEVPVLPEASNEIATTAPKVEGDFRRQPGILARAHSGRRHAQTAAG